MKSYAKKIDWVNKKWEAIIPKKEKPPAPKVKAPIEKAKEYAQQVPKPKVKPAEPKVAKRQEDEAG